MFSLVARCLNIEVDSVIGFPTQQEEGFPFGCVDLQRENKRNGFLFCNVNYQTAMTHCATFATNVIQRETGNCGHDKVSYTSSKKPG